MAVRIRMTRMGRTNRSFFRIGVYESTTRRDGKCLESLGWFDPLQKTPEKELSINLERTGHWLSVGARPTEKAHALLNRAGIKIPQQPTKSKKKQKKETK